MYCLGPGRDVNSLTHDKAKAHQTHPRCPGRFHVIPFVSPIRPPPCPTELLFLFLPFCFPIFYFPSFESCLLEQPKNGPILMIVSHHLLYVHGVPDPSQHLHLLREWTRISLDWLCILMAYGTTSSQAASSTDGGSIQSILPPVIGAIPALRPVPSPSPSLKNSPASSTNSSSTPSSVAS